MTARAVFSCSNSFPFSCALCGFSPLSQASKQRKVSMPQRDSNAVIRSNQIQLGWCERKWNCSKVSKPSFAAAGICDWWFDIEEEWEIWRRSGSLASWAASTPSPLTQHRCGQRRKPGLTHAQPFWRRLFKRRLRRNRSDYPPRSYSHASSCPGLFWLLCLCWGRQTLQLKPCGSLEKHRTGDMHVCLRAQVSGGFFKKSFWCFLAASSREHIINKGHRVRRWRIRDELKELRFYCCPSSFLCLSQ